MKRGTIRWICASMFTTGVGATMVILYPMVRGWQQNWLAENPITPYQSLPHLVLDAHLYFALVSLVFFVGGCFFIFSSWRKDETTTDKSE